MPRIRPASQDEILLKPRAFGLLQQLKPDKDGKVDEQALNQLVEKYGTPNGNIGSELSFDDFAKIFQKPATDIKEGEGNCVGYAAWDKSGHLKPWRFGRRATKPTDVHIQIAYAGICHSDIHTVRNEWKNATYPIVPGHEIVGFVIEVGSAVTKFKVGDRVGVGCMVNSCQKCNTCKVKKEEQFCPEQVGTYNSTDVDGTQTQGGYSTHVLVDENFVLRVPDSLQFSHTAPLLCAGITTYSPIRHFGLDKPGMHVAVVGLGGLGHMAVKFLKAMGVTTTVISRSPDKKEEAISVLGADHYLVSKDEEQMKAAAGTLDGIVNTVSAQHDLGPLLALMKVDGTMVCVGAPENPPTMPTFQMLFRRQRVAGSLIGGIKETQEMLSWDNGNTRQVERTQHQTQFTPTHFIYNSDEVEGHWKPGGHLEDGNLLCARACAMYNVTNESHQDFCAEKNIVCMSEIVPIDYANTAYDRVVKGDVRYRFVIDVQGSLIQ